MSEQSAPGKPAPVEVAVRTFELPNAAVRRYDFWDSSYEWRRLFSELFGTFLLVVGAQNHEGSAVVLVPQGHVLLIGHRVSPLFPADAELLSASYE